ncbi:MAG: protein-L-isoaspartate(D-aspartate) O-methyltransferase [Dokdonella sp.]|jgi:protein-L-isoaspartate(D-aspartate) O-methyltransferase|uniref:protein-L-isoaspartate(D-aspartate) O-methyltransferase n=1 Tax=Dokdonella sp. TaxID=2291710 RepID=UPI001B790EAF|nr:protein-L-isoaspartate(D-aspartate) O-methyltransferase [Dokdonella sp.]MBK8122568.1 protein-L-isoaspartate(D-aspartate) O-methyltransferase [Dokdonella sp.]MBP6326041.1 protein-L-isoaspartate(D-aspartate) O-methyltransferase [Dokdonella sp.]MBP6329000.1 protein-L-isoaspartate(D-aspartate) O-methyltransferase [Dokdonella sp.]HQV48340.1 protein-L-isoaspartate(D-aspartate) O-methyltransferase [Dokdonella sp.]HQX32754.1 protein-L-isoaspartate(D-aspartate) O-methyltransferase [Dokdonella sp.]
MSRFVRTPPPEARGLGMTSQRARDRLIERLVAEGIRDQRVLGVLRQLPRHLFIDEALATRAYEDTALPIGQGQTISQPYVVARMTELLIENGVPRRVLEIGTGSGYQCAVLSSLVEQVFTVERIDELLRNARRRFRKLGMSNIRSRHDDGRLGWPDEAPFDAILVTAAGADLENALLDQLAPQGVLVAPVGPPGRQELLRVGRDADGAWQRETVAAVSFVPLLGGVA